jgi:MoaA/NifB/PqqE/SkfB family radical SAM enzyme
VRNLKVIINRFRPAFGLFQLFGDSPPFPLLILAFLASRCQCRCDVCNQSYDGSFDRDEGDMDPALFEDVLRQADRFLRRPRIHLFGGEPLLNPRFDEFVRLLARYRYCASINTNGERLEAHVDALARGPVRMVHVSLDAIGDRHDELRGRPGLFEKAIRGVRALRARDTDLVLNVNYVVGDAGRLYADVVEFERLFAGTRIDYFSIEHLAFNRAMTPLARRVDVAALRENLAAVRARRFAFPVSATPVVRDEDLAAYYGSQTPLGRVGCNVPWIALNVLPRGHVTPGGAMFACTEVVGDVREEGLPAIWSGEALRAFRRRIRTAMPADCLRCCHTVHRCRWFRSRLAVEDEPGAGRLAGPVLP